MSQKRSNLQSIVRLIQTASLYTGGALPDQNHQSFPIPCPAVAGLRVAFFYCTAAIVKPREGLLLKPPRYIAFFNAETAVFEELKIFDPHEWGLSPAGDEWLGGYLTPAERLSGEFLTRQIRLYQDYDMAMPSFAAGQMDLPSEVKKVVIELRSLFTEISEKPLMRYYQAVGKQFFTWLDQISK